MDGFEDVNINSYGMSACGNTAAIGMLKSGNNGEVSVSADKSVLTSASWACERR